MTIDRKPSAAPGLRARPRADGVVYYWIASAVSKHPAVVDYPGKTVRLTYDTDAERADRCKLLTAELREWLDGQTRRGLAFDGTLASLIDCYQRDEDSPYRNIKENTARSYDQSLSILRGIYGPRRLSSLLGRDFARWYRELKEPAEAGGPERIRRAYDCIKLLRVIVGYGASNRYAGCSEASAMLSEMRFHAPAPRGVAMTFGQAEQFVTKALELGHLSMALSIAMQFELSIRQIDMIGEWVRDTGMEGRGGIVALGRRWQGGITWADLDAALVLRKRTTKTGALGEWDLRRCALVMRVLALYEPLAGRVGPMIVDPRAGRPFTYRVFHNRWREIAGLAGLPSDLWNRDSRAGGITEGDEAGADKRDLQRLATHSSAKTTERYVRSTLKSTSRVADLRAAGRNGGGTSGGNAGGMK